MKRFVVTAATAATMLMQLPATAMAVTTPDALGVQFTSFRTPVVRGTYGAATVHTKAHAKCSIKIRYASGVSHAAGLGAKSANGSGNVSWSWKVPKATKTGSWPVTVTCQSGSNTGKASKMLQVTA